MNQDQCRSYLENVRLQPGVAIVKVDRTLSAGELLMTGGCEDCVIWRSKMKTSKRTKTLAAWLTQSPSNLFRFSSLAKSGKISALGAACHQLIELIRY